MCPEIQYMQAIVDQRGMRKTYGAWSLLTPTESLRAQLLMHLQGCKCVPHVRWAVLAWQVPHALVRQHLLESPTAAATLVKLLWGKVSK